MKKIQSTELARSMVFFSIVWIVTQYLRGEVLRQFDTIAYGAGGIIGVLMAGGLLALKIYSWKRARTSGFHFKKFWKALPWVAGTGLPAIYLIYFFVESDSASLTAWITLFTDLLIPAGVLLFVYVLLGQNKSQKSEPESASLEKTS